MKIILKKDVKILGFKNDLFNVKPGFARNYLIPKGLALIATTGIIKEHREILKQRSKKEEFLLKKAKEIAYKIKRIYVSLLVKKALENRDLAKFFQKRGFPIENESIKIMGNNKIKTAGKYKAIVRLHRKVEVKISFNVYEKNQ
ncbi:MAG TPA: 50S ribosomal protein L9 [Candidatus Angelobacter sp.]|jgi:large subunit ribosomal protein L9|nr:50S ribosomal protein L9 [Candidatus Angelobacter sp.]